MSFHVDKFRCVYCWHSKRIGVGFGICHRLLIQLSRSKSPDSEPRAELASFYAAHGVDNIRLDKCDGLTLILACRSSSRAQLAKTKLLELLDRDIQKQKRQPNYDGHADVFRKNLRVDVRLLDLASVNSVFNFGEEIKTKCVALSLVHAKTQL